ncbi:MAG: hypothetical protein GVY04_02890 [Cyanobacteria bacterium]|jgi:hypothetical protein|nr:hypothetical protein [Cyanobacteria bacterium GSL.Bin1]
MTAAGRSAQARGRRNQVPALVNPALDSKSGVPLTNGQRLRLRKTEGVIFDFDEELMLSKIEPKLW